MVGGSVGILDLVGDLRVLLIAPVILYTLPVSDAIEKGLDSYRLPRYIAMHACLLAR